MSSAIFTSSSVTGQFLIWFVHIIHLKFATVAGPTAWYSFLAFLALAYVLPTITVRSAANLLLDNEQVAAVEEGAAEAAEAEESSSGDAETDAREITTILHSSNYNNHVK